MSVPVPDPLPRKSWAGKTQLDYDVLHQQYASVLVCLYIPVGVYGFYVWLATTLMVINSALGAYRYLKKKSRTIKVATTGGGILNILILGLNIKTAQKCSDIDGYGTVRGVVAITILAGILSLLGELVIIHRPNDTMKHISLWCFIIAAILLGISGPVYFGTVVSSVKVEWAWQRFDHVKRLATIAVLTPGFVLNVLMYAFIPCIFCGCLCAEAWKHKRSRLRNAWYKFVIFLLAGQLFFILWYFSAFAHVILGKIVGDAWGKVFLKTIIAQALAAFSIIVPPAQVVLILFGWGST
ncbi:hypothetical protein FPQ18DRAFT_423310 [Pyronema domesticum]|nr:hypothetical protein FPQ18DRAFT_423310 [Pyronema domesticum]